jgi:hypothetical protein
MAWATFYQAGRKITFCARCPCEWLAWALFGNEDDGIYGQYPETRWGAVQWWLRNPAHNLTFYVMGAAHLDHKRSGMWPFSVFAPGGQGWNCCVTRLCGSSSGDLVMGALIAIVSAWWAWLFVALGAYPLLIVSLIGVAIALRIAGWMPFVSYCGKYFKCYAGWRERGNFGLKLTR